MGDLCPFGSPARVPGQDYVTAMRQKSGKALKRLSPHHHRGSHGQSLESFKIRREVPWQLPVAANHSILRPSDDKSYSRLLHEAPLPVSRRPAKHANGFVMIEAQEQLIKEAGGRLGPKAVITDPREIEPWVTDWRGRVHGAAAAI